MQALIGAERFLREFGRPGELGSVVAEHVTNGRRQINSVHWNFQQTDPAHAGLPEFMQEYLPLQRIVNTVHFAGKVAAPLLLLADACASAVMRWLSGYNGGDRLMDILCDRQRPQVDAPSGYFTVARVPRPSFVRRSPFLTWGDE